MNLRNNPSLDYKVLHREGRKVVKARDRKSTSTAEMTDAIVLEEAKLREDIEHNFKVYSVDELESTEEIKEGIENLENLGQAFRHVHVELKTSLHDYNDLYHEASKVNSNITDYLKEAKRKIRLLKSSKEKCEEDHEREMREQRERSVFEKEEGERKEILKIEENRLNLRIDQFNCMYDLNFCQNVSAIDDYIVTMESFKKEYFELSQKLEVCFKGDYMDLFGEKFRVKTHNLSEEVKMAKLLRERRCDIAKGQEREESERVKARKIAVNAGNLKGEILLRCESLQAKLAQNLRNFGDYQILEISKDNSIEEEVHTVLEKITELGNITAESEDLSELFDEIILMRENLLTSKNLFMEDLHSILKERDITPDKLRNASTLKIEIPKFSGYDAKMDFYTFKSEFEKLVEPTVQKSYLPDYLKRNYLTGNAFSLVENETDYKKIWETLANSFGNTRLLLQNKLSNLEKFSLHKVRDEAKLSDALAKLVNAMRDLEALAENHGIEGQLYEGGGLEKILNLIGTPLHRKFRSKGVESKTTSRSKRSEWESLTKFLNNELQFREIMVADQKSAKLLGLEKNSERTGRQYNASSDYENSDPICSFCEKRGHVVVTTARGNKIVPYYVCESFVSMTPEERYAKMKTKNLCTSCLFPGAQVGERHRCLFLNYCCPHSSHGDVKVHVLLCKEHGSTPENRRLFGRFKKKFITDCQVSLPDYSKQIVCFSDMIAVANSLTPNTDTFSKFETEPELTEAAIFQLQTIKVDGVVLNVFFDNGCGDMVVKRSAALKLKEIERAVQVVEGPVNLTGVGDHKSIAPDGVYSVCLPLQNKRNAVLTGICLPRVTSEFPRYELGKVENHIRRTCKRSNKDLLSSLPKLPSSVGGDTDILIGTKYLKYFPKLVYETENGLGIYKSSFASPCGARGVIGGPDREFSRIERSFRGVHLGKSIYSSEVEILRLHSSILDLKGWKAEMKMPDIDEPICCDLLHDDLEYQNPVKVCVESVESEPNPLCAFPARKAPPCVKQFDKVELSGTEINFRCVDCRDCEKCKAGSRVEALSIQEENEQALIERSVQVDPSKGVTTSVLPFVVNPDSRLGPSEPLALKLFRRQLKTLNANPEKKSAVLESEQKLQELGFVDYFANLSEDDKMHIMYKTKYFLPWLAVFNPDSLSTFCRLVFNASMATIGGCSLNSLLAKGANSMNKLVEVMIRWLTRPHAFHSDVSKMYNVIRLDKQFWRYQLYLWSSSLNLKDEPVWKVIKTLIYGMRSSGNLAECGLRRTAELSKAEYPRAFEVIWEEIYVDDIMSGTMNYEETLQLTDELQASLAQGGFTLKGFAMSGCDPPENLSEDKESLLVGGLRWFPKGDFIMLNIKELSPSRKKGSKKSLESMTKRDCVSIASEVFDVFGYTAPVLGGVKLDIAELHQRKVDWDDPIPNELKNVWISNFDLIQELGNIRFHRAVIPTDAVSLDVETVDTADASEKLICSAIYARYKRKNGEYSCQLIFARTKVIHNLTIPRAELAAALLNASTGHVVHLSLEKWHKKVWKCSDSQVALHWINCTKSALKMWIRNRVVEICRLSDPKDWYFTSSNNMIADLGTRKGAKIEDVAPNSCWINGYPWMKEDASNFPIRSINDVVLSSNERKEANEEKVLGDLALAHFACYPSKYVPNQVGDRYKFSNYLLDPNKFRFRNVIRIMGIVFLFLKRISKNRKFDFLKNRSFRNETGRGEYVVSQYTVKPGAPANIAVVHLPLEILNASKAYYFMKATLEVKKFVDPKRYEKRSVMKDGILYHSGRILASQEIDGKLTLGDICMDLSSDSFCVPITDALSPVAFALVFETHWYHPDANHGGIESLLRATQCTAFIIGGRDLVKSVKAACAKCRVLHKKGVQAAMGPLSEFNLCIAPPFYYSQTDLCGPFKAYSPVNKRATLKIWLVVFCCTITGAVDVRVMESYDADSFLIAFSRFSCRFGYPKALLPDEGSQLVKGCEEMIISFVDLQHRLHVEYGVEFKTCPVGAHNVHGKVERKIRSIKECLVKSVGKSRLSVIQWETFGQQVSNSINNTPIGLGNKVDMLENLDILTPNRLLLGRNNQRSPAAPLEITNDFRRIIESNNNVFDVWFKEWLTSYVPSLVEKAKWFNSDRNLSVGDVILFLKSEREFDRQYQYGIIVSIIESRDGIVRTVEIEYQNHNENINVKRRTKRSVRNIIVIHPIDELGISKELQELSKGT